MFAMYGDTTLAALEIAAIAVESEVVAWTEAAETVLPAGIWISYEITVAMAGVDSAMATIVGIGPGAALMLAVSVAAKVAVSAIAAAIATASVGLLDAAT
jgi:hypothetical protein